MAPKFRPVTLKQVAETAQVSRAAASFALSGRPGVSEDTRNRVLKIAAELGYSPNQTAQNLRSSRTGIVAVYLPENVSALGYYMEATFGIIDAAELSGRTVTLVPHTNGAPHATRLNADGLIIIDPTLEDPHVDKLLGLGLPVVTGEEMPDPNHRVSGAVIADHASSTRAILDRFAAAGSLAPAIITTKERMSWSMSIEQCYRDWCAERGLDARIEVSAMDLIVEDTRRATRKLLDDGTTDAILALTDGSVLTVAGYAAESGRRIGKDLFIAAAVDSPVLGYMNPSVTAVDLNPRDFGQRCMNMLERVLDSEQAEVQGPLTELVPTRVVFRDSTGA
ncbi:LacI family DNA-binding transcriptional regulator [Glutamicibacter endophyticus]